ncbi:DUF3866 family protein [Dethiothermospora halolimnae]|uniref:DUF3866 family protein n=1 Tax=Dethiothermospora halolimnae TaxID=3114390 RepID=UPI003CCC2FA1
MLNYKETAIERIIDKDDDITIGEVNIKGVKSKVISYNNIIGKINVGDIVTVNTTAMDLSLGSGGYHFVMNNKSIKERKNYGQGHIMKLRYTPYQLRTLVSEEQGSKFHEKINSFKSLDGLKVLVGSLHSMLAPTAAIIKFLKPNLKINYIMTDGGALPIKFSFIVKELKKKGIINNTITIGHAFGGDFECVNIYTGLICAKEVLNSDIVIVTMGPGIVGTGTKYGFTGIEQGYILDGVNKLDGQGYIIPRISFADKRTRHKGISHHTITVLNKIICSRTNLVLPKLSDDKNKFIKNQIKNTNILNKHNILYRKGEEIKKALEHFDLDVTTMGRYYDDDKDFFTSIGAVASYVCDFF